ncbi:MAG TPA: PxKF domain-containing protein [Gaiellaceae bacterium]
MNVKPGLLGLGLILALVALLAFPASAAAGTFVVTNANDSGPGSLRQAILDSNGGGGGSITFSIPGTAPTIPLLSPLPPITAKVVLDGTTQPNTPPNTPGVTIALDPTAIVSDWTLLDLGPGSDGSTVHGLAFGGLSGDGGSTAIGVESNTNFITGNWIGAAADSSSVGLSNYGIEVTGNQNTIGGGAATDANLVLGDGQQAISIDSPNPDTPATGNVIQGNLIGFEPDGTPAPGQGNGISVTGATGTVIGNNTGPGGLFTDVLPHPELGNVISGMGDAIRVLNGSSGTVVAGNFIGVDRGGVPTGLNADGVVVNAASGNQIGPGNTIAHATNDGVWIVGGGTSNRIVANSIFANVKHGIELDSSTNSNNNIAAPVITSVVGGTISGTFTSLNPDTVYIEVFVNPTCAAPFATGAGQTFVTFVGPLAPGPWSAQVSGLASGQGITVTATDSVTNDTSQFSNCSTVGLPGGSIAFESNRVNSTSQIFTMNPNGSNVTQLTHDQTGTTDTLPSISPDGHTVVYQSNASGTNQIWAINGDGSNPRQLTTNGANQQPTFSPDGTQIAFDSDRNGYPQLFVMNADGTGQTQVMTTDGNVGGSSWSPDGSQIAFNDDTNGTNQIYTVDVGTGTVTGPLTTSGSNTNPHWSPDGSEILYVSTACLTDNSTFCGGGASVYLMNADGTNQHNLTGAPIFDADPAWSPGGTHIAFVRDLTGQNFNVFTANADGTNQVQLTNGGAPSRNSFPNWGTKVSPPTNVLSNLTVNVTPSSAGAGIDQVLISTIPNAWLSFLAGSTTSAPVGSTPVGSTPVGSTPVGSTPVGSTPVGSTPVGSTPVGSTPVGSTPVGSTGLLDLPVGSTPVGSTPVGSTALSSLLLSQIPLCGDVPLPGTNQAACQSDGATWGQVLAGITSLANQPLNALTLADVVRNATAKSRLAALPLKDVSFATTLFRSVHWSSLLLGSTPLSALPGGFSAWCGPDGKIPDSGGSCTNATPDTSVLQMDVAGQLGSAPVGSTPVGSTLFLASPVGSTPVGSTPVGSTYIPASKLSLIPVSSLPPGIVTCTTCATLGDAFRANAISPTAKFADIANAMQAQGITINDILVAIIGAAGFPWEQLSIQGLQPYSATPSKVTYTVGTQVDCAAAPQFTITAALPTGFFPVNGSAQFAVGNNAPQAAGDPTVLGNSAAAAAKNNAYKWTINCPAGDTAQEAATLTFDSWVGLKLGTFTTHVTAATATASISANGAPVKVHQNPEASDPSTATEIQPDKLIAGHIAFSGEQAFYKVKLDGLPRGTRIQAFLNVPSGADLDLTMSGPAAPSFFSTPVGSTPVGSTPIEDSPVGFSSSGLAVPPDTLQDVPVGSTPVGSTPVGSTPVGSTSANRGDGVNEAGGIITTGQGGYATIGVSGYNGASSNQPFVLRVQKTPPPPLPNCPARNLTVSPANQGTLPSSLPTSTKTVFLVDKQRLMAMYPAADVNSMLTALGALAGRSEVSGSILYVDGDQGVRNAYSAWDATPCDTTARNNVVKAINDVVATYRNSATGLPNLHYVVLVGSDEAGPPMANTFDPVFLSPEENEASDLAFTTSGLTRGNALYASAAQNNILTDGAYGAFTNIPWLDRSLLLPQISVSRLVETPNDILGQVNRYLGNNGISAPQTAAGTLNPTTALVTGYDFLADGAAAVNANLKANFTGLSSSDNFSAGVPTINNPGADWKRSTTYAAGAIVQPITGNPSGLTFQAQGPGTSGLAAPTWPLSLGLTVLDHGITWKAIVAPWNANDVVTNALQSSTPPSILSLDAHYNQYELEAAAGDLANSGQANSPNLATRILFTMGCHGGLNIADTLGGTTGKYLDWPELYAQKQAAMYIANTGYGYGDTASVALSERLLALFAKNLHSDSGSVGEEWVNALQQYFATAGAYDVYDEKVMEETTFYGLPFWHFSTAGSSPSFTPLTTTADPAAGGTQSATVNFPGPSATTQTQFGLYRPNLPITSQQVTSSLPARGVWVKNLSSSEATKDAIIGYPTIDLSAHEPAPNVSPIFFPASPFTLEHSLAFGTERDFLNVSDQFRPTGSGNAGVQRHFTGGTFEILYSQSNDQLAPLISQVNVSNSGGVATITARVTDDSGVAEVAALVNDGTWHYLQLTKSSQDPTLWTGTISVAEDPEVFVEATDGVNVSYSANKGLNFTSTNSNAPPSGVQIQLQAPVGPYSVGQTVNATYQCGSAAAQCVGTVPSGSPLDTSTPGLHTFVVQAFDADGNVVATLQRQYAVDFNFGGFFQPVDNLPALNVTKAGSAIPVKFSLGGDQGLNIFYNSTYPASQPISCSNSAPLDTIETTVTAGQSSLSYDSGSGVYTYIWKTNAAWANTCRALVIRTKFGTFHAANFKFK